METQTLTSSDVATVDASSIASVTGTKTRKHIDDAVFVQAIVNAIKNGKTLTGCMKELAASGEFNEKSLEQKYYKWRKDLKATADNPETTSENKISAQNLYNRLTFTVSGRTGEHLGRGRAKVNRLQKLSDLMSELGDVVPVASTASGERGDKKDAGQLVSQSAPTIEQHNNDIVIKAGNSTITVHQEPLVGVSL